jgi:hypothetical protein
MEKPTKYELKKLEAKGQLALVCMVCGKTHRTLDEWSYRNQQCSEHRIRSVSLWSSPTRNRDKKQIIDQLQADFFEYRSLYWLIITTEPRRVVCPHCKREDQEGVLYRNYVGCRDCAPSLILKDAGDLVHRKNTVRQAIQAAMNSRYSAIAERFLWLDWANELGCAPSHYARANYK